MNPEIYALSLIDWQLFASLTFKSEKLTDSVRIKMFFALVRRQADNFGVHFKKIIGVCGPNMARPPAAFTITHSSQGFLSTRGPRPPVSPS